MWLSSRGIDKELEDSLTPKNNNHKDNILVKLVTRGHRIEVRDSNNESSRAKG